MTNNINPQKEFERLLPDAISNACFSVKLPKNIIEEYSEMSDKWAEDKKTFGHHYAKDQNNISSTKFSTPLLPTAIADKA